MPLSTPAHDRTEDKPHTAPKVLDQYAQQIRMQIAPRDAASQCTYLDGFPRIGVGAIGVGARGCGSHGISGPVCHVCQSGRHVLDETGHSNLYERGKEEHSRGRDEGMCMPSSQTKGDDSGGGILICRPFRVPSTLPLCGWTRITIHTTSKSAFSLQQNCAAMCA